MRRNKTGFQSAPDWYKDAIIYQVHVRAFADSNADGIGDFRGLTQKLGYLRDLGVTALWLLPFYPSPLRDDGYDIADYTSIHPNYGSLKDFKEFLKEAHRLGMHVITELVINHTSDQHPWFQKARRAKPGDPARDFYVWSDTPEKYQGVRIIFKDFETSNWTWDPVANAYYWHRFYSHQPDLNFDNPKVERAVLEVLDFWLEMGVDGLRLDAVPYLYEREGTSCENLPETHAYLNRLRQYVDRKYKNRMLLAEANQWPEDAVAYFGRGDECHMCFHFPQMPRMYMAVSMEDRFPIIDILNQTPQIPEGCQWASFLRNHDELTLEMVTDEERDYMYRMFARDPRARINLGIRRRLAPLLGNNRRQIELMNGLLFSLPGTPVLYYGDEIGMGDNIYLGDRNGVRTPLQWSSDRNAGFSRANPQRLFLPVTIDPEYHYEALNIEAQQQNSHSLLWWMKRLIGLGKRFKAFNRGEIEFLEPENRKVLAFIRKFEGERILVVANLSRHVQCVELDLCAFQGMIPTELFGNTPFPKIGELPYFITLSPHSFYWFALNYPEAGELSEGWDPEKVPAVMLSGRARSIFTDEIDAILVRLLPKYLPQCRWFAGKTRKIKSVDLVDRIPMSLPPAGVLSAAAIVLVRVEYQEGGPETYVMPLAAVQESHAEEIRREFPRSVLFTFNQKSEDAPGLCFDGVVSPEFCEQLMHLVAERGPIRAARGSIKADLTSEFRRRRGLLIASAPDSRVLKGEQSNSSIAYGDQFILKFYRKLEEGVNPDLEIGRFLTEHSGFQYSPSVAGSLEYMGPGSVEPATLGVVHRFVLNEGDAWQMTLDFLGRYIEMALSHAASQVSAPEVPDKALVVSALEAFPDSVKEVAEPYMSLAYLLGQRTMDLHRALATDGDLEAQLAPAFGPEPFTPFYQRSLYQSFRNITDQSLSRLKRALPSLDESTQDLAKELLSRRDEIQKGFQGILKGTIASMRTRTHGDFHLGQVLYTGRDFMIIDFEGEPARSLTERKIKRCPLRDVAGMIRSFHYAAHVAVSSGNIRAQDLEILAPWMDAWFWWISASYLRGYLTLKNGEGAEGDSHQRVGFLPPSVDEISILIRSYVMEKALYEIIYELNNRPDWVRVPIQGILQALGRQTEGRRKTG